MIKITELKVSINSKRELGFHIAKKLMIKESEIISFDIIKRSLDARKKQDIYFVYQVSVELKNEKHIVSRKIKNTSIYQRKKLDLNYLQDKYDSSKKIAVIGFGPAGMFASLLLSKAGVKVTVFERGEQVEKRMETIHNFKTNRILNKQSNVQFGEGGAGTYSDGKLTSRGINERGMWMFTELVEAGAPKEILYVHNPHIGTDILVDVVRNIRKKILRLGSTILFNSYVSNIEPYKNGYHLTVNGEKLYYDTVILGIGHSARDTFEMLYNNEFTLTQKPFAVGFRIEHLQATINKAQYGQNDNHPALEPAEYKLVHQTQGKAVYTFCMCPGGYVVPASSEEGMVCVNGMSEYKRDNINANSALLVSVDQSDFDGDHPLAGMEFQRKIEQKAYELGGSNYNAPIQLLGDFIKNRKSTTFQSVKPSYEIGYTYANLREIYDEKINQAIITSTQVFGRKLKGFDNPDSILTGVEARSSSPVRINRDKESMESLSHKNIYPVGEGAGYAGGIVSAGMDGMKAAEKILDKLRIKPL